MIIPSLLGSSCRLKHFWRTAATRKDVAKVLGELRSILDKSLTKELASKVYLVADELIKNSLEHGCFRIGAKRKAELLAAGNFEELLTKSEHTVTADQWIELELHSSADKLLLCVRDSGLGYELNAALNEKSPDLARLSQRGLEIAQSLSSELLVETAPTQTKATFNLR